MYLIIFLFKVYCKLFVLQTAYFQCACGCDFMVYILFYFVFLICVLGVIRIYLVFISGKRDGSFFFGVSDFFLVYLLVVINFG